MSEKTKQDISLCSKNNHSLLYQESTELLKMIRSAILTTKQNHQHKK
jgi:hypothetical protein